MSLVENKGEGAGIGSNKTTMQAWHLWREKGKEGLGRKSQPGWCGVSKQKLLVGDRKALQPVTLPYSVIGSEWPQGKCGFAVKTVMDTRGQQLGLSVNSAPGSSSLEGDLNGTLPGPPRYAYVHSFGESVPFVIFTIYLGSPKSLEPLIVLTPK